MESAFAPTKEPKDFLGNPLLGVCGMREYEVALQDILAFLASNGTVDMMWWTTDGIGWRKKFRVDTFPRISPALFAMLCAAGWINEYYFPKYTFQLSNFAIQALHERTQW